MVLLSQVGDDEWEMIGGSFRQGVSRVELYQSQLYKHVLKQTLPQYYRDSTGIRLALG